MNRTRRVTATVVAATGLLGGAGAAAATVAGHVANKDDTSASAGASSGRHAETAAEQAEALGRATLEDYVAGMSERADRLGQRVTAAEARLIAARTARARLVARVHARTAALARARAATVEAAASAPSAQTHHASAPATHTSPGASSGGGEVGDDSPEHEDDGGVDD
jgi:hypothetical protein